MFGECASVEAYCATASGAKARKVETYPRFGFSPDSAAVALHDSPADSEPQPGARVFLFMEAFEKSEDALRVLLCKTDAVVRETDEPGIAIAPGGNPYSRRPRQCGI